jgi:hypothetical protein
MKGEIRRGTSPFLTLEKKSIDKNREVALP